MVLTILWQVYMFLSAYESIQACQMMEELLGQVKARILDIYKLEFQVETRAQAKRSKEEKQAKWREAKRTAAAVFFRTFGALSEVHFLHTIYHFKALEVKNPTLQTVHDLELKWGRYGLRKPTAPGYTKISHNTFKIRITHACCEFSSAFADSTLDIFLCILWCNFLSYPCN